MVLVVGLIKNPWWFQKLAPMTPLAWVIWYRLIKLNGVEVEILYRLTIGEYCVLL